MLVARLRKKLEHTLKSVIIDGVRYLSYYNVFIMMGNITGYSVST